MRITHVALLILSIGINLLFNACKPEPENQQPNIIWLSCEDISPILACYGDSTAYTPHIDRLAKESMVFTNAFATVGVCAPSRSSLITGMYPTSIGTMHMRTGFDVASWGQRTYDAPSSATDINGDSIPLYSAVIPEYVKCFTEYLRANGYYCTNNQKTDYQFAAPVTAWDQNNKEAHWKNAPEGMPFFSVFNHEVTHESRIWMNADKQQTVDPKKVPVPDYFPDNEIVRNDIARVYSNIELLDKQIGEKLKELEEAGLLNNSIIFFFSDHGGPLPRGKREHYDSGLQVPFMVRFPHGRNAGHYNELISFVDFAPTVLSLAGISSPSHLQGRAFLGKHKSEEREYIFGSGDRFDEHSDRIRCVRDEQCMYVRNYFPELPRYKHIAYRENVSMMNLLLELNSKNQLNSKQQIWFEDQKPTEELYDCLTDPYQLNNLINDSAYTNKLIELRNALKAWQKTYGDKGAIAEKELLAEMWPNGKQPQTVEPKIISEAGMLKIECTTPGVSIAYLLSDSIFQPTLNSPWKLYTGPFKVENETHIYSVACRIGFKDSEIVHKRIE